MKAHIDPRRIEEIAQRLAGMGVRLTDLSIPLSGGARRGRDDTLRDFSSGGAFGGEAWKELSDATRERDKYPDSQNPARPTSSHLPLIFSGRFRGSVRFFAEKFRGGVTLGPAYWLNYVGTTNPNGGGTKNPERDAGFISQETIDWTIDAILQYAVDNQQKK